MKKIILILMYMALVAAIALLVTAPGLESISAVVVALAALLATHRGLKGEENPRSDDLEQLSKKLFLKLESLQTSITNVRIDVGTLRGDVADAIETLSGEPQAGLSSEFKGPLDKIRGLLSIPSRPDGTPSPRSVKEARMMAALSFSDNSELAISLLRQATKIDPKDTASWINLGVLLLQVSDLQGAERALQEAIKLARSQNQSLFRAQALTNLGALASKRGDLALAEKFHSEAMEYHKSANDKSGLAANYANLGVLAWQNHNLDLSQQYLEKSLDLEKSIENDSGIASDFGSLGVLCLTRVNLRNERQHLDDAERYLATALEISKRLKNQSEVALHLGNLAMVYSSRADELNRSDPEFINLNRQAKALIDEALILAKTTKHKEYEANLWSNYGVVHEDLDDLRSARSAWETAAKMYDDLAMTDAADQVRFWILKLNIS